MYLKKQGKTRKTLWGRGESNDGNSGHYVVASPPTANQIKENRPFCCKSHEEEDGGGHCVEGHEVGEGAEDGAKMPGPENIRIKFCENNHHELLG